MVGTLRMRRYVQLYDWRVDVYSAVAVVVDIPTYARLLFPYSLPAYAT